jgi:hypothetical protein
VNDLNSYRQSAAAQTNGKRSMPRVLLFAVLKTDKEGGAVLEQTIESVKIKHLGEGPDVDTKVLKQLEGARFQVTLDPRGNVVKFNGYDELLKKLAMNDPLYAKLVRALMPEESFKLALTRLFGFLPAKAVAKRAGWERKHVLPLGPLGVLNLDERYTLDDVEEAGTTVKLTMTGKGKYVPPQKPAEPALKISSGEIRLLSSTGAFRFDAAHGRLLGSETKSRLEGTLHVTVRDAALTMHLEQAGTHRLRVLDKNPSEK